MSKKDILLWVLFGWASYIPIWRGYDFIKKKKEKKKKERDENKWAIVVYKSKRMENYKFIPNKIEY